jgi:hypothetical protein
MRYLVKAKVKPYKHADLLEAIDNGTLGMGSVAGGEYIRDMNHARLLKDDTVCWVEVCYCRIPLEEERPYWEAYFELQTVKDAHNRANCLHENGTDYWACSTCDCTERLEQTIEGWGELFIRRLRDEN